MASGRKHDVSGGAIIAILDSEEKIDSIMKQNPFIIQQIAKYEIIGFNAEQNNLQKFYSHFRASIGFVLRILRLGKIMANKLATKEMQTICTITIGSSLEGM